MARKAAGCSRWAAWPASGTVSKRALAPTAAARRRPMAPNLVSSFPGQHQHRLPDPADGGPDVGLGAGTGDP